MILMRVLQLKEALGQVDMLITTGGVSVGDYDYLPAIYEKLGASVLLIKLQCDQEVLRL